jgi:hypothetical protein
MVFGKVISKVSVKFRLTPRIVNPLAVFSALLFQPVATRLVITLSEQTTG